MGKKWVKVYCLLASLVFIVFAIIGCLFGLKGNANSIRSKQEFESIYVNTSFSFIIPSPSFDQIGELVGQYGITDVIAYYETTTQLKAGLSNIKSSVLIFDNSSKLEKTPYNAKRIIDGIVDGGGKAIIDSTYSLKNNCKIGDELVLTISGVEYKFVISAICEDNTYYKDGTVALVLSETESQELRSAGLRYSAAYVCCDDYSSCKSFLMNQYKPYGRLKDRSEFDSDDVYQQHISNFNEADWSKEITDCTANYNTLSVKYQNVENEIAKNNYIILAIGVIITVFINFYILVNKSVTDFMRAFLIKKSGTLKKVKSFYSNGILFECTVFVATYLVLAFVTIGMQGIMSNMISVFLHIGGVVVTSVVMIIISRLVCNIKYRKA